MIVVLASLWHSVDRGELHAKLIEDLETIARKAYSQAERPDRATSGFYPVVEERIVVAAKHATPLIGSAYAVHDPKELSARFVQLILKADCVIAEITVGSLELGMQIAVAAYSGKRILCLRRKQKGLLEKPEPFVLSGNAFISVRTYDENRYEDLEGVVKEFLMPNVEGRAAQGV